MVYTTNMGVLMSFTLTVKVVLFTRWLFQQGSL